MPPLAQDVYDRLAPLPIQLDVADHPAGPAGLPQGSPSCCRARTCSGSCAYLLPPGVVRPIMGQRQLGLVPQQESWDVAIGKHQGAVIQLGYEGVTVEHVLERRLKKAAFGADSRTADALRAAEDSILFLKSERLTEELGERAVDLLVQEPDVQQAREIHARIGRLVHYYRTTATGLPAWMKRFVTTGYSHYATLLPNAFADRGVEPGDLAAMLQFIFTLESLALSLGCERSQLVIAIRQVVPGRRPTRPSSPCSGRPSACFVSGTSRASAATSTRCSTTSCCSPRCRTTSAASCSRWPSRRWWAT